MARNKKVEILSNSQEVLHPMTDGDCVIFEDGKTLTQKLSEDDSVKYTPEIVNSSPMFKVGEGNTVDYSDNVLDGAYERATLQGQTYVNYIQESSADEVTLPTPFTEYERTQHNTLTSNEEGTLGINLVGQSYVNALQHDSEEEYVVLGESLEFQEKKVEYTNEGQIKSAMLKGQTLVNIFKSFANYTYSASEIGAKWLIGGAAPLTETLNNDELTMTIIGVGSKVVRIDDISMLKPNTKYMVKINYTTSFENQINFGYFNNSLIYTQIASMKSNEYAIFTTPNDLSTWVGLWFGILSDLQVGDTIKISKPVLLEYQEGMENWDIPYFEGMQSVTVSTKLENICQYADVENPKTGKTFNTSSSANRILTFMRKGTTILHFKPNTKYLVQFKISNLVLDGIPNITLILHGSTLSSGDCLFGEQSQLQISSNNIYRAIFKTTDVVDTSEFVIKGGVGEWEGSGSSLRSMTISEIMCVEYQNGMENWDLPYFEDYQVMKPVQVESINKNLQPNGTYSTNTSNNVSSINSDDGLIRIDPTKKYRVSAGSTINGCTMRFYDRYRNMITDMHGTYLQIPDNAYYMRLLINIDTNYLNTIQVEESDTFNATEYVPHQSKTTYSWDEVILRKVGDVEDTLDLTTGEWVQRIGEIVLDGSSDESWGYNTNYNVFVYFGVIGNHNFITTNDKLSIETWEGKFRYAIKNASQNGITSETIGRQFLSNNPIKVQYVLKTPIVHKVNLSRPNLQVYDDITHIHTKCLDGTLIPNIYLPSDISYPAILEPSTTYNVCVNHTEVSADNPLKVNVGGTEITMTDSRMTLTTPATLANSNVSFTGKGNKIKESMLIKNSSLLTRDLPHFNGIGSVQLGKTIENLCGSNGYMSGVAAISPTFGQNDVQFTITKAGSCVWVFPIIRPLINGKKYFVYAPNTYPSASSAHVSFRHLYDNQLTFAYGEMIYPISKYTTFTINQDKNQFSHIVIGNHGSVPLNSQCALTYPIICEYEQGMEDWDWEAIGYFTGTKNIGNEFMKVQNKNLVDKSKIVKGVTYNHGGFSTTSEFGGRLTLRQNDAIPVKLNSVYTVSISPSDFTMGYYLLDKDKNIIYDSGWLPNPVSFLIDRPNAKYLIFNLKKQSGEEIEVSDVTSIQIEESSTATTYTAHKHNGLYITKDQPIDLTWEQGAIFYESGVSWSQMTNNVNSMRIRTPQPLTLEPNKTYRVSLGSDKYQYGIQLYDNSNNGVFDYGWNTNREFIFTTTKDKHKVGIAIGKIDSSNNTSITPSESVHAQVRLEEVTDVVLRGIGDVHDELDITRGIYTQRIGEIVLDGTEAWNYTGGLFGVGFEASANIGGNFEVSSSTVAKFINNRYNMYNVYTEGDKGKGITLHAYKGFAGYVFIRDGDFNNVNDFKVYLQKNPITIHYVLGIPIVHKVHIGNKNEANTEITKPNGVFTLPTLYTEQTHIDLTNNGIMPKVQSRDYIAYPVLPMICRTYTLQHNLTGGVSNLTIDLLGRTQSVSYQNHKSLVYSPETMDAVLHNELIISGKGKISKVMYIDGGYMDRDIPYIEGMKNAVNPIVKNVGKNLFDKTSTKYIGSWLSSSCAINKLDRIKLYYIPCLPNTTYTISKVLSKYFRAGTTNEIPTTNSTLLQVVIKDSSSEMLQITTVGGAKYLCFNVYDNSQDTLTEQQILDTVMLTQGVQNIQYEPYKENICYVDCGEIRLTPDMFEQGSITVHVNNIGKPYTVGINNDKSRIRTKKPINIEPNEQYVIIGNTDKYGYSLHFLDKDENFIGVKAPYELSWGGHKPFIVASDSPKALVFIKRMDNSTITPNDVDAFNFQLVKVSEIKQMRSLPHGVHDEIDLETGKYIQRVGEITFNGIENWQPGYSSWDNKCTYWNHDFVDIKLMKGDNGSGQAYYDAVRCSQLHRSYMGRLASALIDGVCSYYYSGYQRIFISKQDCATVNELKLWLKENPITVQYELPEPIVKDIVIHNYPHSYEDGHVIIENGDPNTPIPAQLTYRAVTNRSGQIQQHTEQVEKQEREINELETLILANIHLSQTR